MYDPAFTLFSGLGIVLVLLPLPLQWRARNVGTLLNLSWLLIGNVIYFVNSILWRDNRRVFAEVWCDISIKLVSGFATGLAGAGLCINRRLASIAASKTVTVGPRQRRIAICVDLAVGVGLPILVMVASFIFQPYRFDIVEGVGCEPVTWPCIGGVITVVLPPVVISLISALYGLYASRFFLLRRAQVKVLLQTSQRANNINYVRLIALTSADLVLGLPMAIVYLVIAVQNLRPWASWSYMHEDDWFIVQTYGDDTILRSAVLSVFHYLPRWVPPSLSMVVFLFFGVGDDATGEYTRWFKLVKAKVGIKNAHEAAGGEQAPNLMLGSTVLHTTGSEWTGARDIDEDGIGLSPELKSPGSVDGRTSGVTVTVQRQVV